MASALPQYSRRAVLAAAGNYCPTTAFGCGQRSPNPHAELRRGGSAQGKRASREAITMTIWKILGLFALLGGSAIAATGCENTARGLGADMEQAGQDLQNQDND